MSIPFWLMSLTLTDEIAENQPRPTAHMEHIAALPMCVYCTAHSMRHINSISYVLPEGKYSIHAIFGVYAILL